MCCRSEKVRDIPPCNGSYRTGGSRPRGAPPKTIAALGTTHGLQQAGTGPIEHKEFSPSDPRHPERPKRHIGGCMRRLLRRTWHLLRRDQFEADLTEELDFHRSMKEQQLQQQGFDPGSAQVASRRQLGSILLAKDCARDVWVWPWLQSVAQD